MSDLPRPPVESVATAPGRRISEQIPQIMERWEARVRHQVPASRLQNWPALYNKLPEFLRLIDQTLNPPPAGGAPLKPVDPATLEDAAIEHGTQRAELGDYSIDQVLQEFQVLRGILFEFLEEDRELSASERDVILDAIESAMREAGQQFAATQEEHLRHRDELHRLLVENARDYAMLTTDCANRITSWNVGSERLMLWTEAEVLGEKADLIFVPEDREKRAPEREKEIARTEGMAVNERWHLRKDGSRFWGSGILHALYDPFGRLVGYGKVMRDRTAERTAEEERQVFQTRMRMLAEISSDFLFQEQPQQYLQDVYARLAEHLELDIYLQYLTAPDGRGLHLASHGGIPDPVARQIAYLDFGEAVSGQVEDRRERVVAQYLQMSVEPQAVVARELGIRAYACYPLIGGEALLGTLSFGSRRKDEFAPEEVELIHTVCEQVAVALERGRLLSALRERAAALTEADRRKDEFLAMLAHELRNPLAGIVNAVHLLDETDVQPSPRKRLREIVGRQAKNLTRMVDDLLDVSRITHDKIELRREPLDLASVIRQAVETVRPLIEARGHTLKARLPGEILCVEADRTRLEQVIANLLNNSAKYTEPGGQIWLELEVAGAWAVVRIRDTGVGISAELLPHVFDLFTQANRTSERAEGGLGIGLTLVRRLVEMHGGSIEARSGGLGHGSEFVVRLPLIRESPLTTSATHDPDAPPKAELRARKILVVEDNVDTAETMREMLEIWGHEVRLAHSGPSGLESARTFHPDVILLDIGLPGMNGFEVGRRLRDEPEIGQPCLIAITGYGQDADRALAQEVGFNFHLTKPVDPQRLHDLLATAASENRLP